MSKLRSRAFPPRLWKNRRDSIQMMTALLWAHQPRNLHHLVVKYESANEDVRNQHQMSISFITRTSWNCSTAVWILPSSVTTLLYIPSAELGYAICLSCQLPQNSLHPMSHQMRASMIPVISIACLFNPASNWKLDALTCGFHHRYHLLSHHWISMLIRIKRLHQKLCCSVTWNDGSRFGSSGSKHLRWKKPAMQRTLNYSKIFMRNIVVISSDCSRCLRVAVMLTMTVAVTQHKLMIANIMNASLQNSLVSLLRVDVLYYLKAPFLRIRSRSYS